MVDKEWPCFCLFGKNKSLLTFSIPEIKLSITCHDIDPELNPILNRLICIDFSLNSDIETSLQINIIRWLNDYIVWMQNSTFEFIVVDSCRRMIKIFHRSHIDIELLIGLNIRNCYSYIIPIVQIEISIKHEKHMGGCKRGREWMISL